MEVGAIYEGDNVEVLSKFPNDSVNLIYLDPPFFSNTEYEVIWKDGAEMRAFQDRWQGGIEHYITWMEPRLRECHRVLKETGSIYLHCDWHATAHLRILMDKIFSENNFRNEIIWKRSSNTSSISKVWKRSHDTILFYSKTKKYIFNFQYRQLSEASLDLYHSHQDEKGYYRLVPVLVSGIRHGETGKIWRGINPLKYGKGGMHWVTLPSNLEDYEKKGLLVWGKEKGTLPQLKSYLNENKGVVCPDLWDDIQPIQASDNEAEGFPTQKPVTLLQRIIAASSNEGDIVLDPFCGCGTTLAAAQKLKRKWVGIDISPTACKLMTRRLRLKYGVNAHLVKGTVDLKYVKKLPPFEFQNWVVVDKFLGTISKTKSGDFGVDGITPQIMGGFPIQVKQSEGVGRNVVDNFETAMRRLNKKKGYIVAFSFGKGSYEEAARVKNQDGLNIILRTVQELIDGKVEE